MTFLLLFLRGFLIVALTAMNVKLISRGLYVWAFLTGFSISAVWFSNTGTATDDRRLVCLMAYALGAGAGTVCGMWVGGWL
jgi:hypothetical protein